MGRGMGALGSRLLARTRRRQIMQGINADVGGLKVQDRDKKAQGQGRKGTSAGSVKRVLREQVRELRGAACASRAAEPPWTHAHYYA